MSTVAEIEAKLPQLTTAELQRVEQAVHEQYRQRHAANIYDDSYGIVTESDLITSAKQAFLVCDKEEGRNAPRHQPR